MNVVIAKPQRDSRRENILSIAREVFMEEGYAAASMSTIAARLGGSKGTLYNYFRSKAELFVAVIQQQCEVGQAELFDGVDEPDLKVHLTQLGRRFARLMMQEDVIAIHRIVVAEAVRFPEIGQALYEAGPKRGKARMIAFFEQAMEMTLAGIYRRRLWNVGPPPTDEEIDANVAAAIDTFMAAYGT